MKRFAGLGLPSAPYRDPSKGWELYEPFAGSASLSLALVGAKRPLTTYQGSKWSMRKELISFFKELGFHGAPERIRLSDAGACSFIYPALFDRQDRKRVVEAFEHLLRKDPRETFNSLSSTPAGLIPGGPEGAQAASQVVAQAAAQWLFLQRVAWGGKAVTLKLNSKGERVWKTAGFNKTSAYGCAGTSRFGEVKPQLPSALSALQQAPFLPSTQLNSNLAQLTYIDPPYQGTTAYGHTFNRKEVVDFALHRFETGSTVVISESEPILKLERFGWSSRLLKEVRTRTNTTGALRQEWVTYIKQEAP